VFVRIFRIFFLCMIVFTVFPFSGLYFVGDCLVFFWFGFLLFFVFFYVLCCYLVECY